MKEIWKNNELNIKIKYIKDLHEIAMGLREYHDTISILVKNVCRQAYHVAILMGAQDNDTYIKWQDMIDEEMEDIE